MDERQLKVLLDVCDVGWLLEKGTFGEDPAIAAQRLFDEMAKVEAHYASVFARPLQPRLGERLLSDSTRYKPLVQAFASPITTPMRTMVLCVLDGAQVTGVVFEYELKKRVRIEIAIEGDQGEAARFCSDELWDVEVLRHFGLMKLGDAPVIDGYYAFRKEPPARLTRS